MASFAFSILGGVGTLLISIACVEPCKRFFNKRKRQKILKNKFKQFKQCYVQAFNPFDNCVICFNTFNKSNVICLPCLHLFHKKCIYKWFKQCIKFNYEIKCPICRIIIHM